MNMTNAFARRALKCRDWRWMPGMAWQRGPSGAPDDGGDYGRVTEFERAPADAIPDLRDPATLGCLLALVRAAYADPSLCAVSYGHSMHPDDRLVWRIDARETDDPLNAIPHLYDLDFEVEALVRALEGASLRAQEDEESGL